MSFAVWPVYILVMIVWSVVGFLFWVAILFRVIGYASLITIRGAMDGKVVDVNHLVRPAITFYPRGFKTMHMAFNEDEHDDVVNDRNVLLEVCWGVIFWGVPTWFLGVFTFWWGGLLLIGICIFFAFLLLSEVDALNAGGDQAYESTESIDFAVRAGYISPPADNTGDERVSE